MSEPEPSPIERHGRGAAAVVAIGLAAGLLDRFVGTPSDRHALLVAALVAGVGAAAWQVTERWDLGAVAAATAGLWAIPHTVPRHQVWVAAGPIAAMLVPTAWLERVRDLGLAIVGAALALLAGVGLGLSVPALAFAAVGAFVTTYARPAVPTEGTLRGLRTVALFTPGLALVGLVGVNAGTGWLEAAGGAQALGLGVGLLGLTAILALAVLGLSTLLASRDPAQRSAWLAASLGIVVLAATVPARDVELLRAAGAHALAPLAVLATVAGARVGATQGSRLSGYMFPLAASVTQIPLL